MLNKDQWQCSQSQEEPEIEVQGKVADVEVPWLNTVDVRTPASATEYVVLDNVPWYDGYRFVEECLESRLKCL